MSLGWAYSNNGLGYRISPGTDLMSGEVFFTSQPTVAQLTAAFSGYAAAAAAAAAVTAYQQAMKGPLTVTWSTSTSLNGAFPIDAQTQMFLNGTMVSILTNGVFANGLTTQNWATATGGFVTMTVAQFKAFATAVALYIDQAQGAYMAAAAGQTATWPSTSITVNA